MEDNNSARVENFWAGRIPCWVIRKCIPEACHACSAYLDQSRPCWEFGNTLCKRLFGLALCFACEVCERYGPDAGSADSGTSHCSQENGDNSAS